MAGQTERDLRRSHCSGLASLSLPRRGPGGLAAGDSTGDVAVAPESELNRALREEAREEAQAEPAGGAQPCRAWVVARGGGHWRKGVGPTSEMGN